MIAIGEMGLIFTLIVIPVDKGSVKGVEDVPFVQEYHEPYPIEPNGPGDDVRSILVDQKGTVWAATKVGLHELNHGKWAKRQDVTTGPIYDLLLDKRGMIWVGAWDGLYKIQGESAQKIESITGPVSVLGEVQDSILALGPDGSWQNQASDWKRIQDHWSRNVRDVVAGPSGDLWVATGVGLYHQSSSGLHRYYKENELFSGEINALALAPDGRLWIGALGGIDVYENGIYVSHISGKDGMPNYDVRSLTFTPDGELWIGTALGVARMKDTQWSLRHSRRWLLSDDVRDVAFDPEGTAWIATGAGVSAIKRRFMTLEEKANYFHEICLKRHIRPPGLVEKCYFPNPHDRNVFVPKDDDNDGSYTGLYLVMECLRYTVTKDPQAKLNADKAYDALEFLQTVTGTDGFVARTVIPSDWKDMADPNRTYTPEESVESRIHDPRYKPVEKRWRLSADGKWLWKGDTSSDEITGHMYAYLFYYDLAADEDHKPRVKRLVSKIMDYIIAGGFELRDIDGKPTRWGVWSPQKLNEDPDWRVDAPINSFEILSFLKTTYHITGDSKYQREYEKLIHEYGYAEHARRPKSYGMSERTHIDDELLTLSAPGLLLQETDPALLAIFREGITWAYRTVENDRNPFFNFTFGLMGGKNFHLEKSVAFLRDQPLDLIQWTVDNSTREDLERVRRPMLEPLQTNRMLPPSERGVMRWDKNPWEVISGDFGDEIGSLESCGVFWLLPYWLGRYCGFINPPY